MPNNPSARKRLRQSRVQRLRNRAVRSEIRTRTKKLFGTESAEAAEAALSDLYAALDRAARRHVIPANTAARQKARAARHVQRLTSG